MIPALHDVILMPLRMTLAEETKDRLAVLADKLDELIEQGYTPREIRQHLDKVDAANCEDY